MKYLGPINKRPDTLRDYSKDEVYRCYECGKKSKSSLHEIEDSVQLCDRCFDKWQLRIADVILSTMEIYPISRVNARIGGKVINLDIQKLKESKILVEKIGAPKFEGDVDSKRIALGLPDTPANNAFVLAGGTDQVRAVPTVIDLDDWNRNSKKRPRNSKKVIKK